MIKEASQAGKPVEIVPPSFLDVLCQAYVLLQGQYYRTVPSTWTQYLLYQCGLEKRMEWKTRNEKEAARVAKTNQPPPPVPSYQEMVQIASPDRDLVELYKQVHGRMPDLSELQQEDQEPQEQHSPAPALKGVALAVANSSGAGCRSKNSAGLVLYV